MNQSRFFPVGLSILSSILLYFSFPNFFSLFGFWPLAWVGLVPFFISLEGQTLLSRLKIGVIFSCLFFALLVSWLFSVNFLGYLGFIAVLMSAPVLFAVLFPCPFQNKWLGLLYCPSLWVATEFLRTMLLGGFSWTFGHSQAFHLNAIQVAGVTGSYGISFFLVLFNYCVYRILRWDGNQYFHAASAVFCVLILFGIGSFLITADRPAEDSKNIYEISSIQPNISPQEKGDEEWVDKAIDKHIRLTRESIKDTHPDIVIWPETAIPDDFIKDSLMREKISRIALEVSAHLLLGAALTENGYDYNCAALLNGRGAVLDIYRKKHLVPFSEYLPWPHLFGFLRTFLNFDIYDFHAGQSLGLFTIRQKESTGNILEQKFGVAICSEGAYPDLFRKLVGKGSGFVVLLLNDAWFKQDAAMIMHAQNEIMRAVENRQPIIRAANSGWSCVIESDGRVRALTKKKPFLNKAGFFIFHVLPNHQPTFYNKYGDIFALMCLVFVIINFVVKGARMKIWGRLRMTAVFFAVFFVFENSLLYAGGVAAAKKGRGSTQQAAQQKAIQQRALQQAVMQRQIALQARLPITAEVDGQAAGAGLELQIHGQARGPITVRPSGQVHLPISGEVGGQAIVESIDESQVKDIVDIEDLWKNFEITSENWPLVMETQAKLLTVDRAIYQYKEKGVTIVKPPLHYVQMIDGASEQNPALLIQPFDNLLQFMAIMEYDFDNGADRDQLAKELLGEPGWKANRQRLGLP